MTDQEFQHEVVRQLAEGGVVLGLLKGDVDGLKTVTNKIDKKLEHSQTVEGCKAIRDEYEQAQEAKRIKMPRSVQGWISLIMAAVVLLMLVSQVFSEDVELRQVQKYLETVTPLLESIDAQPVP